MQGKLKKNTSQDLGKLWQKEKKSYCNGVFFVYFVHLLYNTIVRDQVIKLKYIVPFISVCKRELHTFFGHFVKMGRK